MKTTIGLIDPGSKKTLLNETLPHLGLASIAAVLESHGFSVRILDQGLASSTEIEAFLQDGFTLWGISATSFTLSKAVEAARLIKAINPRSTVVIGGPHVSIEMEGLFKNPLIDYAIYGEGEYSLLELAKLFEKSPLPSELDLASVQGLIYRRDGQIRTNPPRPRLTSLDALPFPAYHLFDMSRHDNYPLITSRGCPYGCSFCAIQAIWGTTWISRSPENIMAEIEQAYSPYQLNRKIINIMDDSFNVDPDRALHFCELVLERGLPIQWFPWGIRADRITPTLARKMKEAGCVGVSIGIESADDGVLKAMGKKETVADINRGIACLSEAGLPISATFMIGNIGDTMGTVTKTFDFARRHSFFNLFFYLALPYPKTKLYQYVEKHGRFLYTDYTRFHHFSSKPVFETPEFTARERAQAYAMSRKLVARIRLREEIKRKWQRVRQGDFGHLSWHRLSKAWERMNKHAVDLLTGREDQA